MVMLRKFRTREEC